MRIAVAGAALAAGFTAVGSALSDPQVVLFAEIPCLIFAVAAMVAVVRTPRLSGRAGTAAMRVVGMASVFVLVVPALGAIAVICFAVGVPDPVFDDAATDPPPVCNAITSEQNLAVPDGATLDEVQAILGRPLALREQYRTGTGSRIAVYEWQQIGSGCDQYVSYEFLDGKLSFRRWGPAS